MRKRKWQTVLYIFLIFVLSYFYILMNQLYFSPEDAFYACERGLRYPPSKEIMLEFDTEDGGKVLVGRQEEGLFVVPVEKTHFFFWRRQSGGVDGYQKMKKPLDGYLTYDGSFLGMCQDESITEMSLIFGNWEDRNWKEFVYPVEEGLIYIECGKELQEEGFDLVMRDNFAYMEGRTADGEVVCWDGEDGLARALRGGHFTPEAKKVTKPYPVAPNVE